MKGQLNVKTPAEYIAAVDDKRRSDIAALDTRAMGGEESVVRNRQAAHDCM